jgi:ABC-type Fe3+-hydroxamate transport system substrate-binding protein
VAVRLAAAGAAGGERGAERHRPARGARRRGGRVGRTDYDTAAAVRGAASVGGGVDPSVERILALRPDLVVAWPEPSAARVRDACARAGVPVYAAGLRDTSALYATVAAMGALTGRAPAAAAAAGTLRAGWTACGGAWRRARRRRRAGATVVFVASSGRRTWPAPART